MKYAKLLKELLYNEKEGTTLQNIQIPGVLGRFIQESKITNKVAKSILQEYYLDHGDNLGLLDAAQKYALIDAFARERVWSFDRMAEMVHKTAGNISTDSNGWRKVLEHAVYIGISLRMDSDDFCLALRVGNLWLAEFAAEHIPIMYVWYGPGTRLDMHDFDIEIASRRAQSEDTKRLCYRTINSVICDYVKETGQSIPRSLLSGWGDRAVTNYLINKHFTREDVIEAILKEISTHAAFVKLWTAGWRDGLLEKIKLTLSGGVINDKPPTS